MACGPVRVAKPGGRSVSRKVAEGRAGGEGPDPAPTSQSRSPHGPSPTPPRRPDSGPCSHSAPTAACTRLPRTGSPGVTSGRGPVAPSPVLSRGAAAPGGRWTRAGMLRHRAGAPGHGVRLRSSVPACVARGLGGDSIRLASVETQAPQLRRPGTAFEGGARQAGGQLGAGTLCSRRQCPPPVAPGTLRPSASREEGPEAASGTCAHPTCRVPREAGSSLEVGAALVQCSWALNPGSGSPQRPPPCPSTSAATSERAAPRERARGRRPATGSLGGRGSRDPQAPGWLAGLMHQPGDKAYLEASLESRL